MSDLIERIKKRIDKEWSFQEGCREEAKRNNKRKDVNEIGGIMDGLNIAGSFFNEESAKEPDAYEWRFVGSVKLQNRIMSGGNCSYCGKMAYWFATDDIPKYCPCCGRKIKVAK